MGLRIVPDPIGHFGRGGLSVVGGGVDSLLTDLVDYWTLADSSRYRLASYNNNHLDQIGTVSQGAGKITNAADFTVASSQYLIHSNNARFSTGDIDFTFAGWFYLKDKDTYQFAFAKDGAGATRDYSLLFDQGNDCWSFSVFNSAGSVKSVLSVGSPPTTTFVYIACGHDAANDVVWIQVNNGTVYETATAALVPNASASQFRIGASQRQGLYLGGRVCEFGFWKRKLTLAERTRLYNGGAGLAYAQWSSGAPAKTRNILTVGDSKTVGVGSTDGLGYRSILPATANTWEPFVTISESGRSTETIGALLTSYLATAFGAPEFVLYNTGANDFPLPLEATWKANYASNLDQIITKFPSAKIYAMRVWRRGYNTECNTLATWQGDVEALRSDTFPGPDERVFLKGSDDGATYTGDGIHPNDAGYALTASQWKTTLGL